VDGNTTDTTVAPYQRTIVVPSVTAPGTKITVTATAEDAAGNKASDHRTLTVAVLPDTVPPVVTLNAPSRAAPGTTIRVSATATANVGVRSLSFGVNGVPVASFPVPPFETTIVVPPGAQPGSSLAITAQATDYVGNQGTANALVTVAQVVASAPPTITL